MLDESVNLFVMEESLRVQAIASSIEDSVSQLGSLIHLSKNEPQILIVNAAAYLRFCRMFSSLKLCDRSACGYGNHNE